MISAAPNSERPSRPSETMQPPPLQPCELSAAVKPIGNAGRWTVVGMLSFGFLIVGALWYYWDSYTRPFRPLQQAIAAAYPTSQPYVVGGRIKSHLENSPYTFRIVLQMAADDFNPEADEKASLMRAIELYRLATRHQDLKPYSELEVFLVQPEPEQPDRQWSLKLPLTEWPDLTIPAGSKSDLPSPAAKTDSQNSSQPDLIRPHKESAAPLTTGQ